MNIDNSLAYKIIEEAYSNAGSVQLYENEGIYYVPTESVENYIDASGIIDINEAIENIAEANDIDSASIVCIGSFDEEYFSNEVGQIDEALVLQERALEDGAMSLKQAKKAYNKILQKAKSVPQTKSELDRVISSLETCIKKMKEEKSKVEDEVTSKERVKYSLKSLIPFNSLYRTIKLMAQGHSRTEAQDVENDYKYFSPAFAKSIWLVLSAATHVLLPDPTLAVKAAGVVASPFVRYKDYTNMLDGMIKDSEEALKFLKEKRDNLKDSDKK